ncbi:T9SS type A sorting domain-containing protein [Chryseobacterium sp. Leaf394]|uniref:T9SS type A sorting domain-containing protein n=1 Tax=Chryseobacterium sp. Leaf394 TaxID=1736361 RepID=UPI0006F8B688|nr:T9SS type A sorting domain-containing protein [Chryseobacterium sp. Leaf394]KQS89868.1 hypothetical protein ASG21_12870 [Chryseobacterium sp. Leaf394]
MCGSLYSSAVKLGFAVLVLFVAGNNDVNAQQWENVGSSANVSAGGSSFNNLVVDNTGNYYLSYYDVSVQKGSVQKFNGTAWSYVGGSAGITNSFATYNSLSINTAGTDLYYTNQGSGLEVRHFNGTSWTQLASAATSTINYHASAVAPSGVLFTYSTLGSGTVKRLVNGIWEQVGNAGFSNGAAFAEMVIGTNNKVYTSNVASGVRVYENTTTAVSSDPWALVGGSIVDAASSGEQYTSDIAIDSNNNLYVAYVSNSANSRKVNVKKFNGTSWEQVGNAYFSAGGVQHVALAVTSSGKPYVVASRWENDNFLRNTAYQLDSASNTWSTFGGDFISDGEATYNDLAVDNVNNYLLLAYSQGNTKVKRITIPSPSSNSSCNNTDPGTNVGDLGCVTFNYKGQSVTYTTVRGADGKIWLQQNLGSSQVATSLSDADSYGDLFQWGRWDDGHQVRNSSTANAPSPNSPNGLNSSSSFILGSWWGGNDLNDQWTATSNSVTAVNGADPCKAVGPNWQMPSQADWTAVKNAEGINNPATAYESKLKLPAGGNRSFTDGSFGFVGQRGYFWSSTPTGLGAKYLYVGTTIGNPSAGAPRGQGSSVRCIKPASDALSVTDFSKNNSVGIHPNPTNGILYIKSDSQVQNISVSNFVGQKMVAEFRNNQIDMTFLVKGIYIVEVEFKNGQKVSKKIIKN